MAYVSIPPPSGPARLRRRSGLVVSFLDSTTRTRPDQTRPTDRLGLRQVRRLCPMVVSTCPLDLDMYGLCPRVWSGRVGLQTKSVGPCSGIWLLLCLHHVSRLCVLAYRCLIGTAPSYLAETLHSTADVRSRRRLLSASI